MTDHHKKKAEDAFNRVRNQLCQIGLLADGVYLDQIELCISGIPSLGEAGFVYDSGVPWLEGILGYQEGVIYLPRNIPHSLYKPGGTLTDVIRHEFAHAWAWLDRDFLNGVWFKRAFGRWYDDEWPLGDKLFRLFWRHDEREFKRSPYYRDFVSPYAMKAPYEDFAETFMTCLRYWGSAGRFRYRPGLYQKIMAVRNAIDVVAKWIYGVPAETKRLGNWLPHRHDTTGNEAVRGARATILEAHAALTKYPCDRAARKYWPDLASPPS